jgi:hypothetical protein
MNWDDQRTRIRRFLRDPNANLWTNALLLRLFNDSQRTIQQRTNILEDLQTIRVPPLFNIGYLYDFEWRYIDSSSSGRNYQALQYHQAGDIVFSYRWEVGTITGISDSTEDEGSHYTQPWEGFIEGVTPGAPIPIWFPENFDQAILVAWDKRPLEYIDIKKLMSDDETWVNHSGKEAFYYRYNDIDNCFILSPLPDSPVWDDLDSASTSEIGYTFDWEETTYGDNKVTITHSDESMEHFHVWEGGQLDGANPEDDAIAMKGTSAREIGEDHGNEGIFQYIDGDTLTGDQAGGVIRRDGTTLLGSYYGVATDVVDDDDNVLVIYKSEPQNLESDDDETEFPRFIQKYIEHQTLARAYTVDNDGKIESLRDYWAYRAELGIKLIIRYMQLRKTDRDYRLTTPGIPGRITRRHPRLPDAYPAV